MAVCVPLGTAPPLASEVGAHADEEVLASEAPALVSEREYAVRFLMSGVSGLGSRRHGTRPHGCRGSRISLSVHFSVTRHIYSIPDLNEWPILPPPRSR